jgi:hypothetical protein
MTASARRRIVAILVATCCLAAPARAAYRVIEARDLRMIYPGLPLQFIAPYTTQCFENSMRFHRALWGYDPRDPVTLVLDDTGDYSNAGVSAAPRTTMSLHIAPSNFVFETGPANERINFTMNHEVVHVVALDKAAGQDVFFRGLFHGKVKDTSEHPETMLYDFLTVPRRAAPRWYHEGIAVFLETWMSGGLGRAQGPYDEMVFRSMVKDDSRFYDPLGLESEGTKVDFQIGVNSYLYGTRFMSWLALTYGPDSLIRWVGRAPGSRMYFASQFERNYGRSLSDAWHAWIRWEHEFQRAQLDSVRRYPVTGARDLSPQALGSVSRACADSAAGVFYAAVWYPGAVAHLAAIPMAGGAPRFLHEVKGPALYFVTSLAWDPDARRLFFTSDNNEWRELESCDPATGRTHVLIRDARVGDLAFDRTTKTLYGVRHFNGISSFVKIPPPYHDFQRLYSLPYGLDAYDLDISPDGRTLCASFAEISGRQTLRLIEKAALEKADTTTRVLWDFGTAVPTSFTFSPDGRRLFGSSYYTGVSNIFRYDLDRDSMDVVSNAETGFFRPVPTRDDSLVVFRYTGQGFVPAKIDPRPLQDVSAIEFLGARIARQYPVLRTWKVPPPSTVKLDSSVFVKRDYHALSWVRPGAIYPIVEGYRGQTAAGLSLDLSDPVGLQSFNVTGSWTPSDAVPADERLHAQARWQHLDLTASFRWNGASFYDLFGPVHESRKGYASSLGWKRTLIRDRPRTLELSLSGSHYGGLDHLPDAQNVSTSPGFDQLVTSQAELHYSNMRSTIGAPDVETGHQWRLGATGSGVRLRRTGGADWKGYPFAEAAFDVGHPLGLPHVSGWLRTAAGWSPGHRDDPFANFFFGGFGNNWIDRKEPKRYRDTNRFPGLPIDDVAGTNYVRGMIDLNLPALRFRRAGVLALYASWARVSLFGTGLATNLDDDATRRKLANAGAQLDIRFQLFTQQPLTLSGGYARAFERGVASRREWMASLKVL